MLKDNVVANQSALEICFNVSIFGSGIEYTATYLQNVFKNYERVVIEEWFKIYYILSNIYLFCRIFLYTSSLSFKKIFIMFDQGCSTVFKEGITLVRIIL